MTFVSLVLVTLASARITRLIVSDTITAPARAWVVGKLGADSRLVYLVHCSWCSSIYVGAGVASTTVFGPGWVQWIWLALTASYVTGWLDSRMED